MEEGPIQKKPKTQTIVVPEKTWVDGSDQADHMQQLCCKLNLEMHVCSNCDFTLADGIASAQNYEGEWYECDRCEETLCLECGVPPNDENKVAVCRTCAKKDPLLKDKL